MPQGTRRIPIRNGRVSLEVLAGGGQRTAGHAAPYLTSIDGDGERSAALVQQLVANVGMRIVGLSVGVELPETLIGWAGGTELPTDEQLYRLEVLGAVTDNLIRRYGRPTAVAFWDGAGGSPGQGAALRHIRESADLDATKESLMRLAREF